jgi:UDP-N-acetylmuramyl pentapeptide phosphotransferase/UDP-N-acetylglucosamine-1-phosphate transferase
MAHHPNNVTSIEMEIRSNLTTLFMAIYSIHKFRPTGMSFIYYKYRNGPKTYTWSTPDSIGTLILSPSIITVLFFHLWRIKSNKEQ